MIANSFKIRSQTNRRSRHDTLGVDIGSSAIKMVRMRWKSGCWNIVNRISIPVDEPVASLTDDLQTGFLQRQLQILQGRSLSSHHECACVLPMTVTDIRSVEVPQGPEREVAQMAREQLRDVFKDDFSERVTRIWHHSESPHDMAMVSGISVLSSVGEKIVDDLNEVGFDCHSMTSLPFALAKAATMSPVGRSKLPIALLSWQHSSTTLVIARQGRPEFIRTLRDCSGRSVNERIANGLGLSPEESHSVLAAMGEQAGTDNPLFRAIEQYVQPEVQNVCAELRKTMMYLRHHLPRLMPTRLVLFGGMATVHSVCSEIAASTGLETKPWSLNADNSHVTDPVYAPAMAASAGVCES